MQNLSEDMINSLYLKKGEKALDLACGTGFVSSKLSECTKNRTIGVDISEGMIKVAQRNYGNTCDFIQSDMTKFLNTQPSNSYDVVTCAWGLGYTQPYKFIKEISRILRSYGRIGIIDLSIFSNLKMYLLSFLTLIEKPDAITYPISVYYLSSCRSLNWRMRLCGISILDSWNANKVIYLKDAEETVKQLSKTGSIAVIESIIKDEYKEWFIERLKQNIQKKYEKNATIPLNHHYIASVGIKK
jgi:SAM-dependent methyltransferase